MILYLWSVTQWNINFVNLDGKGTIYNKSKFWDEIYDQFSNFRRIVIKEAFSEVILQNPWSKFLQIV